MLLTRLRHIHFLIIVASTCLLCSCSVEHNTALSKGWHNTLLRYNKYYYADLKVKEVEKKLWSQHKDDYNDILKVYPDNDTNIAKTLKEDLNDIMKKASIGIAWHGNSKWVDDSYILIGKARLYGMDMKNAQETFKYVNTKSKVDQDRYTALIWLMQKYIRNNEMFYAKEVYSFLLSQDLNKKNKLEFYKTAAYYHQKEREYPQTAVNLVDAIPNFPTFTKRENKARIYFITAQIYQKYHRDSLAHANYRACIKHNPPYELSFYAKLYYAQVASLDDEAAKKRITRYFKKLLKDPKNEEYKDKIYYEMGKYEYKQKHIDQAIELLVKSVRASTRNTTQKGYSYLKLAEIYYDDKQAYLQSKLYYDSTLTSLPKEHPDYKAITKRKQILDDFVKHYTTVKVEDSLQRLADMDSLKLNSFLTQYIEKDYAKQKENWDKAQKAAKKKADADAMNANIGGGFTTGTQAVQVFDADNKWYFYNSTLMAAGLTEFKNKWGNRKLDDNWRRSTRENSEPDDKNNNAGPNIAEDEPSAKKKNEFEGKKIEKSTLLAKIPLNPEARETSDKKVQEAMYHLGKIYYLKLDEPKNGISTYRKLDKRYSDNKYSAEVLYSLYLAYQDQKKPDSSNYYKNQLFDRYPKSEFAMVLKNPNFREDRKKAEQKIDREYEEAYTFFKWKQYRYSDSLLNIMIVQYPENESADKVYMLKTMIVGRTSSVDAYKDSLDAFKTKFPKSKLTEFADNQIKGAENAILNRERVKAMMDKLAFPTDTNDVATDSLTIVPQSDSLMKKPADNLNNASPGTKTDLNEPQMKNQAVERPQSAETAEEKIATPAVEEKKSGTDKIENKSTPVPPSNPEVPDPRKDIDDPDKQ